MGLAVVEAMTGLNGADWSSLETTIISGDKRGVSNTKDRHANNDDMVITSATETTTTLSNEAEASFGLNQNR